MFNRTENFKQYITMYPAVSAIIATNIFLHLIAPINFNNFSIFSFGVGVNYLIAQGEWWRFITPMFLHSSFMHLLFNMFSIFLFGPELERLAGKVRFLTIYILSGIISNLMAYIFLSPETVHIGASGAIYGILGSFAALVYYTRKTLPYLRQIILPIIAISVVMTFIQPNVNMVAHFTGLTVGFLIGLAYFHPKNILSWRKQKIRRIK